MQARHCSGVEQNPLLWTIWILDHLMLPPAASLDVVWTASSWTLLQGGIRNWFFEHAAATKPKVDR